MVFDIFEGNIERLDKKMAVYKRKFEKLGATLIYEQLGEKFVNYGDEDFPDIRRFVVVNVEGVAKINGWQVIGKVERTATTENELTCFIHTDDAYNIINNYRFAEIVCDHCNTKAKRKHGYILQDENGVIKMVGSSCLSAFCGVNATAYASLLSLFDDVAEFQKIPQGEVILKYYKTDKVLAVAIQLVDKYGYTAKYRYDEDDFGGCENLDATATAVHKIMVDAKPHEKYNGFLFNEKDEETKKKVQELKDFFKAFTPTKEYESNLCLALQSEYCTYKKFAILTAGVQTKRIKEKEMKRLDELTSVHFGAVGDKIELTECEFTLLSSYESVYGYVYIHKIVNNGNTFIWKTSKKIQNGVYNIKGTIKGHSEYKGEKQTELTRVKIL